MLVRRVWLSEETRFQLLRGVKTVIHNQTFYCTSFPSAFFSMYNKEAAQQSRNNL